MKKFKLIKNIGDNSKDVNGWAPVGEIHELKGEISMNVTIFNKLLTIWLKPDGKTIATKSSCRLCGINYQIKYYETNEFNCRLHRKNLKLNNNNEVNSICEYKKSIVKNDMIFILLGEISEKDLNIFEEQLNFSDYTCCSTLNYKLRFSTMWVSFYFSNMILFRSI